MTADEKARPRREAKDGQKVESQRHPATDTAPTQALTVAARHTAQGALRAACVVVTLCSGRRPEQVFAEIAGRAFASLQRKGKSKL